MDEVTGADPRYRNFVWDSARWDRLELRDDDVVISTPPKCGTTWMQMQVALLLFRTPELPAPLAKLSPWLDMNTRPLDDVLGDLAAQAHRRFIKTHTPLPRLPWRDSVTYLHVGRDPRDAAMSWDNHMQNVSMQSLFEARATSVGLDDLAELGIDGPPELPPDDPELRFWLWVEGPGTGAATSGPRNLVHHCGTFWAARERPNVHLFHYGDQRADLATEMGRLAGALGVDPPDEELVAAAGFEQMKARADELAPNTDVALWQSNAQFFDKARSGDWQAFMGDGGTARYEAALAAASRDPGLTAWLHGGRHAAT